MSFSRRDTPYLLYGAGAASGRCERPPGATPAPGASAGENPSDLEPKGSKSLETLHSLAPHCVRCSAGVVQGDIYFLVLEIRHSPIA